MSVFYMVEMSFPHPELRSKYDVFYDRHISMLLTIEGFQSGQRFESIGPADLPFLALYQLADDQVLERPTYTSRAGPASVNESIREKITLWHRNLVTGPEVSLDVPIDQGLLIIDRVKADSAPLPPDMLGFRPIGLDRSWLQRGVKVMPNPAPPSVAAANGWVVRTFKPLHPRRSPGRRIDNK